MIRARALDLIEGRLSIIESARALSKLTHWSGPNDDPDLTTFVAIDSETDILPVREVRKYWATHALEREDVEIAKAEDLYRSTAIESARRLVERFEWSLEAKAARRNSGHAV
jgi:hypothetical protein